MLNGYPLKIAQIVSKEWGSLQLTVGVEILSPSVVESRDDIERLKADLGDTDAYWVIGGGRGRTTLLLELARRYPHPLIGGGGVGLPPFLRSRGFEAYPSLDDDLLSLLRVRKAIGLTKALVIKSTRIAGGCLSSAWDLADIETRLGVGFDSISNEKERPMLTKVYKVYMQVPHQDHHQGQERPQDAGQLQGRIPPRDLLRRSQSGGEGPG